MTRNIGRYGANEVIDLALRSEATVTAQQSGSWDDPATWDGGVPGDGDEVLIDDGVEVILTHQDNARLETLRVDGKLSFDPREQTKLRVDTIVVSMAGEFEMGTAADPISASAEVEFLNETALARPDDRRVVGRGLLVLGDATIHGAQKTTWDALASHAQAGDQQIELSGDGAGALSPHRWQVGDEIVLPDQEPWGGVPEDVAQDGVSPTATDDDEVRTIEAIDGNTITLNAPLDSDHAPPEAWIDSYVLNLSRSVRFESEASEPGELGHLMFMSSGIRVSYCECRNMGRTRRHLAQVSNPLWERGESETPNLENPRARYPIHFHRTGPEEAKSVVTGCSVVETPGWGYVNHGSHVDFIRNTSFRAHDIGFVTEKGGEAGVMEGNFALRSNGSGEEVDSRKAWSNTFAESFIGPPGNIDDFAHHGGGFWVHSPIVEVRDNVAAGHRAHGFFFHFRQLHERPLERDSDGNFIEHLDGKNDSFPLLPAVHMTEEERDVGRRGDETGAHHSEYHEPTTEFFFNSMCRLRTFENNVCFGCGAGASFRSHMFRSVDGRHLWAVTEDFLAYNIGDHYLEDGSTQGYKEDFESSGNVGIDHRYVANLLHRNYTLIGGGDGIGINNNKTYTNTWDVESSEIRGWEYGFIPKRYAEDDHNIVRETTFDNDVDILLPSIFPIGPSGLALEDCTFQGDNWVEWEEIFVASFFPSRVVWDVAPVAWEERNLYHGWCDPEFVVVQEGDSERLNKMMKHGHEQDWRDFLDGDDPRSVLPGATHQELWDEYGIQFFGGMKPSSEGELQSNTVGSGGDYDSKPFFGPESKTQPTDEIWVEATDCSLRGKHQIVSYGDGVPNEGPLQYASNQTAVQLTREDESRGWGLPVTDRDGVASHTFEIDRTGTYQVFLRSQQGADEHGGQNLDKARFYVRIDGGEWKLLQGGNGDGALTNTNTMRWGNPVYNDGHHLQFDLGSTGEHTIEVAGKGEKMRLDKILINHINVAAAPYGTGKPTTPKS